VGAGARDADAGGVDAYARPVRRIPFPVSRLVVVPVVLALAVSLGASPGLGATSAAGAQAEPGALEWQSCQGGFAECATLTVALDDAVPDGPTIDLGLVRIQARDPEHRIGSLVVNPGGPGAPATDFVVDFAPSLPDTILDRFDIVGIDPRGVGDSEGVDCLDDLDPLYELDWTSTDAADRAELVAGVQAIVDACVASDGAILPYLGTARTVRDMDLVRAALGDEQLSYLGFSYGTYIGALYAAEFPDRVRAFVLDGAVDPALDATAVQVEQSEGFEHSLDLFLADCAADSSCAFHHDGDPGAAYDALRAQIAYDPIPARDAPGRRELNTTLFDTGVTLLLYDGRSSWATLADALRSAERGDGSDLVQYADVYTGRTADGRYDDLQEQFWAVGCADGPGFEGVEGLREIEEQAAAAAPRLGRSIVNNSLACALWPVQPGALASVSTTTEQPILVLGTRNDPATPLAWAKGLAAEIGPSARLVVAKGSRHTAFLAGNGCVDRIVLRYLVDESAPKSKRTC